MSICVNRVFPERRPIKESGTNMKINSLEHDAVRNSVRDRYGRIAESNGCGCGPTAGPSDGGCCGNGPGAQDMNATLGYSAEQAGAVPAGANLGLGCGNPLALASLTPGQTVLDLGSGAGFDAFLAARAVGPTGRVIGVDMTPEMVSKARNNQAKGGYSNVDFRLGEIEHLPVADASVDVIISNCVINLSPDKGQVFREAFRVLKPGGRLAISDVVGLAPFPESLQQEWELYTGCIAGASPVSELTRLLELAGFRDIRIAPKAGSREIIEQWFPGRGLENFVASATISAVK